MHTGYGSPDKSAETVDNAGISGDWCAAEFMRITVIMENDQDSQRNYNGLTRPDNIAFCSASLQDGNSFHMASRLLGARWGPTKGAEENLEGVSGGATITAGEALNLLNEARPNSIETTESRLRDKLSIGAVRSWGKPIPKEAIPLYLPSLEEIPQDVWKYAQIDLRSSTGPLPTNSLGYLRAHETNTEPLYNAVRFDRREIEVLCREERIAGR